MLNTVFWILVSVACVAASFALLRFEASFPAVIEEDAASPQKKKPCKELASPARRSPSCSLSDSPEDIIIVSQTVTPVNHPL